MRGSPPARKSSDQDVGAALLLAIVGRPVGLDPLVPVEDDAALGGAVVGCGAGAGAGEVLGVLLALVAVEGGGEETVLGARLLDVGTTGAGWTTPPAGVVCCTVAGRTFR